MDRVFKSRETQLGFFIPHVRCSGWFITSITGYATLETRAPLRDSLQHSAQACLWKRAFSRYRMYFRGDKIFLSAPAEDLDHLCDALYCFQLAKPTSEECKVAKVTFEHGPLHKDVHQLIAEFILHENVIKAKACIGSRDPEDIIANNYLFDMVAHIAGRLTIDLPMVGLRDNVIRGILHSQVTSLASRDEKAWVLYNNIWFLNDELNRVVPRPADDKNLLLCKFFPITRQQFRKIKRTKFSLGELPCDDEMDRFFQSLPIDNHASDTQPVYNYQVRKGYGLYVSSSKTYTDWKPLPQ